MKRGSRFLIGLASAGLSFGALMATLGPAHFNKYGHRHCGGYYYQHYCCDHNACTGNTQK